MEKYEDTQAGADSRKSRIQGTANGKKEGNDHTMAKKSLIASKMQVKEKVMPFPGGKGKKLMGWAEKRGWRAGETKKHPQDMRSTEKIPRGTSGWDQE